MRALAAVAARFELRGEFEDATPHGSGHIHDTYAVRHADGSTLRRTLLQRLNTDIFRDPGAVMENVRRVCAHLESKLAHAPDAARRSLHLIPARDGRCYHVDDDGRWWRAFRFVESAHSVDAVEDPGQAYQAGRAFGEFAAQLADLPGPPPAITLPRFHDLAARFAALESALTENPEGRADSVADEADAARRTRERAEAARAARTPEPLPIRVVHNDCKINNLLLDDTTGEGLCVIDLDTVMEGTVLADFGELTRTATCRSPEDEADPSRIRVEGKLFEALARGYVSGAGALLRPAELAALPLAGPILALENAVRFLADHLYGDVYFRVQRPRHNLDRCRAQLRQAELLLAEADAWTGAVEAAAREIVEDPA